MDRNGEMKRKLDEIRERRAQLEKDRKMFDEFFKKQYEALNTKVSLPILSCF